jgi:putative acetyltransferase
VAVRPDVQSQGIGSRLIREGLRLCKESGYDYCVVLGDPKYYQRFGFKKASQFGVQNEYGVDEEFMMIHFSKYNVVQGLVKYAPEFAMFAV